MSGATDPAQAASADDNTPPPIIRKVANRIMWWLIALYFVAILDLGNVAYAAVCGFRGDRAHHSEEFPPGIPS